MRDTAEGEYRKHMSNVPHAVCQLSSKWEEFPVQPEHVGELEVKARQLTEKIHQAKIEFKWKDCSTQTIPPVFKVLLSPLHCASLGLALASTSRS